MYRMLTFLALFSFASNAMAFTWGVSTKITGYYIYASGGGAFINVEHKENPDNCANGHYLALDGNAANFQYLYSTIMAAQASGQNVNLNYDGCFGDFPKIISIAVPAIW